MTDVHKPHTHSLNSNRDPPTKFRVYPSGEGRRTVHHPLSMAQSVRPRKVFAKDKHGDRQSKARVRPAGRSNRTVEQRIDFLRNHPYVRAFGEYWVLCAACGVDIKLDDRNGAKYFPNSLIKHLKTRKCKIMQREMLEKFIRKDLEKEVCDIFTLNDTVLT